VASALNEIAEKSRVGIRIQESAIPIRDDVKGACEILGLDPLYVGNEGSLLAFVPRNETERVLNAMRGMRRAENRLSLARPFETTRALS
jgi:hydrogenase expression/formation protein HypE